MLRAGSVAFVNSIGRVSMLVAAVVFLIAAAPASMPFQRLDHCVYKPQRWDDGDSFHVILPDQKELIFRVYFVDTPEEERVYVDRIEEQAKYFGISPDTALEVGHAASEFTKRALEKPFTVYTRWRRALGRSNSWRYYAMITTADGHDLNELLVSNGLARIYGTRTPLPDGRDSREYLAHLQELENEAKEAKVGAWGKADNIKNPAEDSQRNKDNPERRVGR